ncbi:TIGR02450 family Trp-rich protein [Paraglaciecola sp.]|uniref:TIGR02450 family Trp-rich protein n=1 Tax=Paraglaciecola sp. TaxID=1920173 RepID=UPI0030F48691
MHYVNPKKLLTSKWTAVTPQNKEKHFIVSEIEFDDDEKVLSCSLEAVLTKRIIPIQWQELKDANQWLPGWQ